MTDNENEGTDRPVPRGKIYQAVVSGKGAVFLKLGNILISSVLIA